jgi:hypothetical protein
MLGIEGKDDADLTDEQRATLERSRVNNDALKEPDEVAEAVYHALFSDQPKFRYMVVPNENQAKMTVNTALKRAIQLNHDQPYSYSREALIEMLDQLLIEMESPAEASESR